MMAVETLLALVLGALLVWGVWAVRGSLEAIAKRLDGDGARRDCPSSGQIDELIRAAWALQSLSPRPVEPPPRYDAAGHRRRRDERRELHAAADGALSRMLIGDEDVFDFVPLLEKAKGLFGAEVAEGYSTIAQSLVTMAHLGGSDAVSMREFIWDAWQRTQRLMLDEIEADDEAADRGGAPERRRPGERLLS